MPTRAAAGTERLTSRDRASPPGSGASENRSVAPGIIRNVASHGILRLTGNPAVTALVAVLRRVGDGVRTTTGRVRNAVRVRLFSDRAAAVLMEAFSDRPARVAVLTRQRPGEQRLAGSRLARALGDRGAVVSWFDACAPPSQLHVDLAAAGPFDLIVDETGDEATRVRLIRDTFFHLRAGGSHVLPWVKRSITSAVDDDPDRVGTLLARLRAAQDPASPGAPTGPGARRAWELASALESADVVSGCLRLVSRSEGALAKLDEPQATRFLELRGSRPAAAREERPPARIAARRSGGQFRSRCTLRQNTTDLEVAYEPTFTAPDPVLRDIPDAICAPGQVVAYDNVLLPDTYRHNQQARLRNPHAPQLSPYFARVRGLGDVEPPRRRGTFFHLDNEERGHFGHAMTEQLSRLWALHLAREVAPDLKVLVGVTRGRRIRSWERELWAAIGIPREQMALIRRPVRVERLLTATPMLSMPAYVHPGVGEVWRTLGDNLVDRAPAREYPRRVFCTRVLDKRACRNGAEVEALFASHGFTVLRPELLSLPEQARTFREAEVIAGYAGSGMLGTLFATEPKRVITVTSRRYAANNEYLIASVLGHRLDQVFCEPDSWNYAAPYLFDHERDGAFLREVLDEL